MPFQCRKKSRNLQPSHDPSWIHLWFLYIDTQFTCFCIWTWPDQTSMGWHLVRIAIETILQIPVHRLLTSPAFTSKHSNRFCLGDDLQKAISTCCNHLRGCGPMSIHVSRLHAGLITIHIIFSIPWATTRGSIEVLSFMDSLLCCLPNPWCCPGKKWEKKHIEIGPKHRQVGPIPTKWYINIG